MDEVREQEVKLSLKLNRLLAEYDLESFLTTGEVEDAILDFKSVLETFENVHVTLKSKFAEYSEHFPRVSVTMAPFNEWVLKARRRSRDLRKVELDEQSAKVQLVVSQMAQLSQKESNSEIRWEVEREERKVKLRNAWKRLTLRVKADLRSIATLNSDYPSDLNRDIAHVRQLLRELSELDQDLETVFGDDYSKEFEDVESCRSLLNDAIGQLMQKGQRCQADEKRVRAAVEKGKEEEARQARERINRERIDIFSKIYENIKERHTVFHSKYSVALANLTDDDVLNRHLSVSSVDTDLNDFMDQMTELVKVRPEVYQNADALLRQAEISKENIKVIRTTYIQNLSLEIERRDLSEQKLNNATGITVEIPKFKDYTSEQDYYTFKANFQKFVMPYFQAKYLPDQLKNKYLDGQALLIVKELNTLHEIWARLEEAFGNVDILLTNKLKLLGDSTPLGKIRDDEKLVKRITEIVNIMTDLSNLAARHDIEATLYHSSNLAKIYSIIGDKRHESIIKKLLEANLTANDKASWETVIEHLRKEIKVKEQVVLYRKSQNSDGATGGRSHFAGGGNVNNCVLCGKNDHIPTVTQKGYKILNYFSCDTFAKMTSKERFNLLRQKKFCMQCLYPGSKQGHVGPCKSDWNCPHPSHNRFPKGLHVLICETHKDNPENVALLEAYKTRYITYRNSPHRDFSKNMALTCCLKAESDNDSVDVALYMMQTIKIGDGLFNIFYDSGCMNCVTKKEAVDIFLSEGRAEQTVKGPLTLYGVNEQKSVCEYGKFKITLPLNNGKDAIIHGICVDKITETMPTYPLTRIKSDLDSAWGSCKRRARLPRLPDDVGGDTHIMLGIVYNKWFPTEIFRLPSGLAIYRSKFASPDGSTGVVGGPHPVVSEVHRNLGTFAMTTYFSDVVKLYRDGCRLQADASFLSRSEVMCPPVLTNDGVDTSYAVKRPPKNLESFEAAENAGTVITYRCVNCRGCQNCLKSQNIEAISYEEEMEQELIDRSVTVDLVANRSTAYLPFLSDPNEKLAPNDYMAKRIYKSVTRSLKGKEAEKEAIRKADKKLHDLGFVDYLDNLSEEMKQMINASPVKHYLAWRIAWNANSISTPARPVYDASLLTSSGYCLNDLLAKGTNNMNKLLLIFLRWRTRAFAYHTDLQTMYNRVGLVPEHWCFQLYFWENSLDPDVEPLTKVFKTVTYGISSSGNQASVAIRKAADMQKDEYPRESEVINDDTYVDDCFSGEDTDDNRNSVTDGLVIVLEKAGFPLKGFTFSGYDPPAHLTKTGTTITVAGTVWHSKDDDLSLNIPTLNFSKKRKGRKQADHLANVVPENFTRRHCAARVGEVFDLIGQFTPITAGFKLDLNALCRLGLDWDDPVPEELQGVWKENFQTISNLEGQRYRRVVIPKDAINLDMQTLEMADASESLACSAVYVRIKRKDGSYHCQLMFARSKILPKNMIFPRPELFAAELNATTGHIVNLALGDRIVKRFSLTDNQITLYWISNTQLRLKRWPRNRVTEIRRLTDYKDWYYVEGKNMTADIGTRKGVSISDISETSRWVNGEEWATGCESKFPIKSVDQLLLSEAELNSHSNELLKGDVVDMDWIHKQLNETFPMAYPAFTKYSEEKIKERYTLSDYLIDPLKFRFRKVVRTMALVIMFVSKLKESVSRRKGLPVPKQIYGTEIDLPVQFKFVDDKFLTTNDSKFPFICPKGLVLELTEHFLKCALTYYFRKATNEVKAFKDKNSYKNISEEKDGVLFFTGRILPSQKLDRECHLADVCLDLSMNSFCVPLVEKYSPVAYAIVNEVHWFDFDVFHSGNETVLRNVSKIAHIFGGRSIVCDFRADCPRCRFLEKRRVQVAMGPIPDDQLCVAPAFYNSQVDLCGPFKAFSSANKRATVKIWFCVFVCCTTGAVDLKVLEDYSTRSFVQAFTRFSCKVGYPRKLLPDAGSQLIKGCESTTLVFSDIQSQLHEVGVTFQVAPSGAHYMHGKVERKIRHVKESFDKHLHGHRLSIIDWETLGDQIANAINNLPIGVGNLCRDLENIDLITPNRLLLARNNNRSPAGTLEVTHDVSKLIEQNDNIFKVWFQAWVTSCVQHLTFQPKWFKSDEDIKVGDVVLFLKSDKEFEKLYQYGLICEIHPGRDQRIRRVTVEYQNKDEKTRRKVSRGTREIVVIHPVGELGLVRELNNISSSS